MTKKIFSIFIFVIFTNSLFAYEMSLNVNLNKQDKQDLVDFINKYWDLCEKLTIVKAKTGSFDTRSINIMSKLVKTGSKNIANGYLNECSRDLRYKNEKGKMQYPDKISTTKRGIVIESAARKMYGLEVVYYFIPDETNPEKKTIKSLVTEHETSLDGKTFYFLGF